MVPLLSSLILWLFLPFSFGQEKAADSGKKPADSDVLVVERDQDVAEDVIAFAKNVMIRGIARRGVAALGGSIVVEGTVRGDLAVVGGSVEIRDGAIVQGDVIVIGGNIHRDPLGRVDGRVFATSFYQQRLIEFFRNPSRLFFTVDYSPQAMTWRMVRLACWFVLTFLIFKLFTQQILRTSRNLELEVGKVVLAGLVGSIALATSLIVFLALCVILIGVPLVIVWGAFTLGVWTFGSTAVYYVLGSLIARTFFVRRIAPSPALLLLTGLMGVGLLRLLPLLNFFIPYIVFAVGLGAVIHTYALSGRIRWWGRKTTASS